MARLIPLLLLLCAGCSASAETRDPSENCADDFELMARGAISCEQLGDQCAYRTNPTDGISSRTELGAPDAAWVCTCGGEGSSIKLYWCKEP